MRGSLGEKINQGGTADIHAWAPGQVVKLFKERFPPRLGQQEARMTQAVFAAGVPAPEMFGEVALDGRFGIVLGRLDGPTLLQVTRSGAVTFAQAGAILASFELKFLPFAKTARTARGSLRYSPRNDINADLGEARNPAAD